MRIPEDIKRALPQGWRLGYPVVGNENEHKRQIGASSGSHPYVLDDNGEPLRGQTGIPIRVSLTPRGPRSTKNDVARIRRALRSRNA